MNTFLKNYWSLYMDFLHDFKTLTYRGFSLSFLIGGFHSQVKQHPTLWQALSYETFAKQLRHQVTHQRDIQEVFNAFVQSHTKQPSHQSKHGKVMLHVDKLLRFPVKTFQDYFDPAETMILNAGRSSSQNNPSTKGKAPNQAKIQVSSVTIPGNQFRYTPITKGVNQIPIKHLQHYSSNTAKASVHLQNKARAILKSYSSHPLYKDPSFQRVFLMKIEDIIERIEQCHHLLDHVPVSCIVVSTTHSFISRILALVAAERGIPTICMQHGIMSGEFGFIPKIATVDAVYGHFEVDWYKKAGAAAESLEIIGHPRFDQALTNRKLHTPFNHQRETLMIVMRNHQDIDKWRTFIHIISKNLNVNIIIKNYPRQRSQTIAEEFPFVYFPKNESLYALIHSADCVVSYASTVGLEAMIAGKSVFILNEDFIGYTGYYDDLGEMVQADPRKLAALIIKYFNEPDCRAYAQKKRVQFLEHAYPDTSSSGKRLKRLVHRLSNR